MSGAVECAWLDQFFTGGDTGDPALQQEAAAALATSHDWPMLIEIADDGGWAQVLWDRADAINGEGGVLTGGGPMAPSRSDANAALGCDI